MAFLVITGGESNGSLKKKSISLLVSPISVV